MANDEIEGEEDEDEKEDEEEEEDEGEYETGETPQAISKTSTSPIDKKTNDFGIRCQFLKQVQAISEENDYVTVTSWGSALVLTDE